MIIASIQHVQAYTDAKIQMNINSLRPLITSVARKSILPYVPVALYNTLNELPEPPDTDTGIYPQLLRQLREAMANLLLAAYVPRGEANFGATGIIRNEGENDKSPYRYQTAALYRSYYSAGVDALDAFLQLCYDNADDITEWKGSDNEKAYNAVFIKSGADFSKLYMLRHPQLTYMALLSDMADAEAITLNDIFGKTLGNVKEKLTNKDTISAAEAHFIGYIRKALAALTIVRGIPRLNLRLEDGGLTVVAAEVAYYDAGSAPAAPKSVSLLAGSAQSTAMEYIERAKTFLNVNAGEFPDWTVTDDSTGDFIDNSCLNGVMGL